MNPHVSPVIYKELINGRVINRDMKSGHQLVENPLYTEIFENLKVYQEQYLQIGFDLFMAGDAFLIRDSQLDDQYRDVAIKIQVLMDLIAEGVTRLGLLTPVLTEFEAGISDEQLQGIGEADETQQILRACNMGKGTFVDEVNNLLVNRGLAYRNHYERLVLSNAGTAFFEELLRQPPPVKT